jgi:catechol 2,3-dioxygenase-like lactoylglutathione lyase family enzyme
MAKIRHIAIKVEDQEKTAEFYKKTFGMTEAWRGPVREDGNRAIYLTDGYINMAVLPARGGRFAEMGVHDPVGQLVDVTVHGWKV